MWTVFWLGPADAVSDGRQDWVLVSGAAGALGQKLVATFANRGRPVLALDRAFGAADAARNGVICIEADLTSESDVKSAFDRLDRTSRLGLVINAVGLIWNEPVLHAQLKPHAAETWRQVIEANLTAGFLVAAYAAQCMARRGGGTIVNFSSISARGNAGQAAYAAAKSGIEGLTRSMAAELGPLGIRVNAIAPGFIDVASTRTAVEVGLLERYVERTPIGRLGAVEELVSAIDFLESNSFVTGTVLALDGGLRL